MLVVNTEERVVSIVESNCLQALSRDSFRSFTLSVASRTFGCAGTTNHRRRPVRAGYANRAAERVSRPSGRDCAVRLRRGFSMARDLSSNACEQPALSVGQVPHEPFSTRTGRATLSRALVHSVHEDTGRAKRCRGSRTFGSLTTATADGHVLPSRLPRSLCSLTRPSRDFVVWLPLRFSTHDSARHSN